jgi:hypothetical protein
MAGFTGRNFESIQMIRTKKIWIKSNPRLYGGEFFLS